MKIGFDAPIFNCWNKNSIRAPNFMAADPLYIAVYPLYY